MAVVSISDYIIIHNLYPSTTDQSDQAGDGVQTHVAGYSIDVQSKVEIGL